MSDRQQVAHATPAWFIPVVGLLDLPLALPSIGLPPMHGLMVLALAVGFFFAVPIFTLIFSRLLFEPPLPDALKPSLLIFVAPFAVGYSTYTITAGQTDLFAEALYMLTPVRARRAARATAPPAALLSVSRLLVGGELSPGGVQHRRASLAATRPNLVTDAIAIVLLALATLVIAALLGRTLWASARESCGPSAPEGARFCSSASASKQGDAPWEGSMARSR